MGFTKTEKFRNVNSTENSIAALCTIISTALSLLNALNIGPFKTANQTGDVLIISLGIPLILILIFTHLYLRIISIFILLWSFALIYKYLFDNNDLEILIIIGVLAFSVYFTVGFVLRNLARATGLFRFLLGKNYKRFSSIFLFILIAGGGAYYLANKPLQAEAEAFVNRKLEKIKQWIIANHIRRREKGEFQRITLGKFTLNRRYDFFGETSRYYGDDISLRYKNSIYGYFDIMNDKPPVFRFVINYVGTDKCSRSYSIKSGKKKLDLVPKNLKREKVFIWFIETSEYEISVGEFEIINLILNPGEVFIRYREESASHTHFVSAVEKKNLLDVLNAYRCILCTHLFMGFVNKD